MKISGYLNNNKLWQQISPKVSAVSVFEFTLLSVPALFKCVYLGDLVFPDIFISIFIFVSYPKTILIGVL